MFKSHTLKDRNSETDSGSKICSHDTTDSFVDFVKARAIHYQQKELARLTGLSIQQVKNLRLGLSGIGGKALTNWIRNCPRFAGDYAEYTGIIRPGEAETSEALSRLANAFARRAP